MLFVVVIDCGVLYVVVCCVLLFEFVCVVCCMLYVVCFFVFVKGVL